MERNQSHPWWLLAAVMLGDGAFVVLQVPSPSFGAFGLTPLPMLIAETLTYLLGGYLVWRFRLHSSRALYFACAGVGALSLVAISSGWVPANLSLPLEALVYVALALLNLCWGVCFASFLPAVSTVLVAGAYLLWSVFSLILSLTTGTDAGSLLQIMFPIVSVMLLGFCLAKLDFRMRQKEAPNAQEGSKEADGFEAFAMSSGMTAADAAAPSIAIGARAGSATDDPDSTRPARLKLSLFAKVALGGSLAFSFLFGTMMQIDALLESERFITSPEVQLGIIAISLAVLLYALKAKPSSSLLVMIIVPIVLATVLMGRSLVGDPSFFTSGLPAVVFNFFGLFIWVIFAWEGHRSPLGGFVMYALGLGSMRLGLLGGRGFALALSSVAPLSPAVASALSTISLWILFIGCLAIGLLVMKRQKAEQLLAVASRSRADAADAEQGAHEALMRQFEPAFDVAGLTAREREIMGLYVQGRSAVYIAEKLVLSNYTVKTHIRRAYAKLGVHSRQELLDLAHPRD